MTPQPHAARRKSDEDSAAAVKKGPGHDLSRELRRQLASQRSTQQAQAACPPSSGLTRQRERQFDREEAHLTVYDFCKRSQRRERCSHRTIIRRALREHRVYISINQLSHRPSQLKMQRHPIPRAHTKSRVFSPSRNKETTVKMEHGVWFVCEDRQSESYHSGTTGQTVDSPR